MGKLLVVELVVPPGNDPSLSKISDVMMMTHVGGINRTEDEYRELLDAAGFKLETVIPTPARSIIEAVPV